MNEEHQRQIAIDYFNARPQAKQVAIEKGKLLLRSAWQATHRYQYDPKTDDSACWVCGESWYGPVNMCPGFAARDIKAFLMVEHIKDVLSKETELYQSTIAACAKMVKKKYSRIEDVTGKDMAFMHPTHGCDPEILEWILNGEVSREQRAEYEVCMEQERTLSRSKLVKQVITAV